MEAMHEGMNLKEILRDTRPVHHRGIIDAAAMRQDVLAEFLNSQKVCGTKV